MAVAIANDYQRREAKILAAFYDFGNAVDGDHVVLQIGRIHLQEPAYR
jgi:hypothetical protein